jgi:hypothetical protein
MTLRPAVFSLSVLIFAACERPAPPPETPAPSPPSAALPPAPIQSTAVAPAAPAPVEAKAPPEPAPPTPLFRITDGISTPESVLYDEVADRYLVSNINGKPTDVDGNGSILELSPEGKVVKDKFIAGGVNQVKLDAPKGSGISGGVLYVTDITVVRKFDAKTGAPKGDIPIPGSAFLNDIAVAKDGRVFVSDSGMTGSFEPTGAGGAVHVIDKAGKVKTLAKSTEFNGANGLLYREKDKALLVVSLLSNELYRLDDKGARQDVSALPEGGLDGIVAVGDDLLISSWKGSAVYRGKLGQKFERLFAGLKGPADIGFDSKRSRLLVPRFNENAVEVYEVK